MPTVGLIAVGSARGFGPIGGCAGMEIKPVAPREMLKFADLALKASIVEGEPLAMFRLTVKSALADFAPSNVTRLIMLVGTVMSTATSL